MTVSKAAGSGSWQPLPTQRFFHHTHGSPPALFSFDCELDCVRTALPTPMVRSIPRSGRHPFIQASDNERARKANPIRILTKRNRHYPRWYGGCSERGCCCRTWSANSLPSPLRLFGPSNVAGHTEHPNVGGYAFETRRWGILRSLTRTL